jgi:hypothetical protein
MATLLEEYNGVQIKHSDNYNTSEDEKAHILRLCKEIVDGSLVSLPNTSSGNARVLASITVQYDYFILSSNPTNNIHH